MDGCIGTRPSGVPVTLPGMSTAERIRASEAYREKVKASMVRAKQLRAIVFCEAPEHTVMVTWAGETIHTHACLTCFEAALTAARGEGGP